MQENLVIVESPAKAKTIEKFLGNDFKVMSSYGHIRDLKKTGLSVDLDTFEPYYEISDDKKKVVSELQKAAKDAKRVWLGRGSHIMALVRGFGSRRRQNKPYRVPRDY